METALDETGMLAVMGLVKGIDEHRHARSSP
jgi:hypothetical protein